MFSTTETSGTLFSFFLLGFNNFPVAAGAHKMLGKKYVNKIRELLQIITRNSYLPAALSNTTLNDYVTAGNLLLVIGIVSLIRRQLQSLIITLALKARNWNIIHVFCLFALFVLL